MELPIYRDMWEATDPHANFKADVANYTVTDPLPTLENLSQATGIPVPCLVRYVLVKWAASGAEALLALRPIVLEQMRRHVEQAEAADTDAARLEAYESLRQMISWMELGSSTGQENPEAG
jgi:hypothetical protein